MDILFLPLLLIMGLPIGLMQLFSGFGILYALPVIALIVSAVVAYKRKNIRAAILLAYTACIGQWFSLISWIASRHDIPASEATHTWGLDLPSQSKAGFPISAMEIPPSPMGGDIVPAEMWSGVFANHLIWFAVALGIAALIVTTKKTTRKRFPAALTVVAAAGLLYNLAMFALWFD